MSQDGFNYISLKGLDALKLTYSKEQNKPLICLPMK